ncbi:MAG: hypothetical protein HY597_07340 [Candidatus Omnitrophica bacterium]|nr:hypothetical protein [Candidatus Omnitrophota bacterium]
MEAHSIGEAIVPKDSTMKLTMFRLPPCQRFLATFTSLALLTVTCLQYTTPAFAEQSRIRYFHPDHLGSTTLVTDEQGQVVQEVSYKPYGEVYAQAGAVNLPHKFTGQRHDVSTGLYYYNARYYDPQLGRFIQPDTVVQAPADPQTLNRYSYARNNPVRYVDPTGYSFWSKFFGSIAAIFFSVVTAGLGSLLSAAISAAAFGAFDAGISAYQAGAGWNGAFKAGAIGAAAGFAGSLAGGFTSNFVGGLTNSFAGDAFGSLAFGATSGAVGAGLSGGSVGRGTLAGAAASITAFTLAPLGPNAMFLASSAVGAAIRGEDPVEALKEGAGGGLGYTVATTAYVHATASRVPASGQIDAQPGDRLYYTPDSPIGLFVVLLEGGPFSHVNVYLGDGKVADNSLGTNTQERQLSKFAGRPYVLAPALGMPQQSLSALTGDLAKTHPRYNPIPTSLWVCSTCTSTMYGQAGLTGLSGIGPNAQYLLNDK